MWLRVGVRNAYLLGALVKGSSKKFFKVLQDKKKPFKITKYLFDTNYLHFLKFKKFQYKNLYKFN